MKEGDYTCNKRRATERKEPLTGFRRKPWLKASKRPCVGQCFPQLLKQWLHKAWGPGPSRAVHGLSQTAYSSPPHMQTLSTFPTEIECINVLCINLNPSRTKGNLSYLKNQFVPRSKQTASVIKTNQVMPYREIIAVFLRTTQNT